MVSSFNLVVNCLGIVLTALGCIDPGWGINEGAAETTAPTPLPAYPPFPLLRSASGPTPLPTKTQPAPGMTAVPFSDFSLKSCPEEGCTLDGHFIFSFPLPAETKAEVDAAYRYGETQKRKRPLHHGVDLKAALGTPVLAAAQGTVVAAGKDDQQVYGETLDFYGNLVVLKHVPRGQDAPVYTLYGHLSKVTVKVGQQVVAGEKIGEVGMTGIAIGYHLHFEVRSDPQAYLSTQNPELWLTPPSAASGKQSGVFTGRIVDPEGKPLRIAKVVLERVDAADRQMPVYLNTYDDPVIPHKTGSQDDSFLMPVSVPYTLGRDRLWLEDFCLGGLEPGKYQFSFTSQVVVTRTLEIKPGKVTYLLIQMSE